MRTYSADLRTRIHQACLDGGTTSAVALRFAVSTAFVRRLKQRFRESGSLAPRSCLPRKSIRILASFENVLAEAVRLTPDRTAAEYREQLCLPASVRTVTRTLSRLGLTRKKSRSRPASSSVRT